MKYLLSFILILFSTYGISQSKQRANTLFTSDGKVMKPSHILYGTAGIITPTHKHKHLKRKKHSLIKK